METKQQIPCQKCGRMYPDTWRWFICMGCGFRICPNCLDRHEGQYGRGFKCSRCPYGQMQQVEGRDVSQGG